MEITRFNLRVYGLLISQDGKVLLVHEKMPHLHFTKFPGGGLEFGEGTRECLAREFMEETGIAVKVTDHLYTTDFFQPSAFLKHDQLISIYYRVEPMEWPVIIDEEEKLVETGGKVEVLRFFWKDIRDFDENILTFPVDRIVARKFLMGLPD